jgi:ActR/RegA family two-component response regulator
MTGSGAAGDHAAEVDYRRYPILYVDDDALNLRSFRALFDERFEIVTASRGEEALALLGARPVAVLLSDQRLGQGMSGTDLCAVARERHPEVVRMIVTAYADITTTIAGINAGQISRYIAKPWKRAEMDAALRSGIDEYDLRAFTREVQAQILGKQQQATAELLAGRVLRELCNPTTAVHINLACAASALRSLDPVMGALPAPFAATLGELHEMIRDAGAAAAEIIGQIDRLREGEAAPRGGGGRGEAWLDRVLRAALTPLRAEIARRAALRVDLGAAPRVAVEPSVAAQIVLNILPLVVAACDPARAAVNEVAISTFADDDAAAAAVSRCGGFTIRFPAAGPAGDAFDDAAGGAGASGSLAMAVVRELVDAAGGRLRVQTDAAGARELRVELPLAA